MKKQIGRTVGTVDFALSRVFYVYGHLEGKGLLDDNIDDLEAITQICVNVANEWEEGRDIRNENEEGHPVPYAERVLLRRHGN